MPSNMSETEAEESSTLGDEIIGEVKREAGAWLKWAATGAVLGAVILGGLGFYLLGFMGLLGGAAAGAVLGAIGLWLFYLNATTL